MDFIFIKKMWYYVIQHKKYIGHLWTKNIKLDNFTIIGEGNVHFKYIRGECNFKNLQAKELNLLSIFEKIIDLVLKNYIFLNLVRSSFSI